MRGGRPCCPPNPEQRYEIAPPHCRPPGAKDKASYQSEPELWKGLPNVRFGSEADMCGANGDAPFTPNSDRKRRHAANGHVRFTPESRRVQCKPSCMLWARS